MGINNTDRSMWSPPDNPRFDLGGSMVELSSPFWFWEWHGQLRTFGRQKCTKENKHSPTASYYVR
eukprot:3358563-Amphidinium_carterae.1